MTGKARIRMGLRRGFTMLLVTAMIASGASAAVDPARVDGIVEDARKQWGLPGVALAVIDSDGGIYAKGYGVRDARSQAPVTPDTLFGIGSCSKAFAAATVAKLVDDRRIGWEDRVDEHLPWFRTNDPFVTHDLRVRDLLTHRTGLHAVIPRDAATDRLSYLKSIAVTEPNHPLRYEFSYTNDMFTLAGALVSQVSGKSWDQYARETLWNPLGMRRTNGDHRVARQDSDAAAPHTRIDGKYTAMPWVYEDRTALPSGGVNSSAADMAQWLKFQLAQGRDGALLSPAAFQEMHSPHTPLRGAGARPASAMFRDVLGSGPDGIRYESYGMGWFMHDYRGHKIIFHGGSIDGFRCFVGLVPEKGFGVAVLINSDQSSFPSALGQSLIDMKLGFENKDWPSVFHDLTVKREADAKIQLRAQEAARIRGTRPSRPLSAYAGTYAADPVTGSIQVRLEGKKLILSFQRIEYEAVHWHYDMFRLKPRQLTLDEGPIAWPWPSESRDFATFQVDEAGKISEVETRFGEFRRAAANGQAR